MSILTSSEIRKLVSDGNLISDINESSFQPCSYDMRIGSIFRDGQVIDGTHHRSEEQISLAPGEVITMTTLEELTLPPDIAGTVHAINAQSSEGLLVLNPGHVDPGYKGTLTVMAVNMRRVPYVVSRKDKIFTVVFQRLSNPANPSYSNRPGTRSDKERDLNKKVVEKAVTSLGDLIGLNSPFTRPEDVDKRIRKHWATIVTMVMSAITLLASVVAAIFAVAGLLSGPWSVPLHSAANTPSPAPVSVPPEEQPHINEPAGSPKDPRTETIASQDGEKPAEEKTQDGR